MLFVVRMTLVRFVLSVLADGSCMTAGGCPGSGSHRCLCSVLRWTFNYQSLARVFPRTTTQNAVIHVTIRTLVSFIGRNQNFYPRDTRLVPYGGHG